MPREIPEVMIDVIIAEALGEGDDGIAQVAQVMFNRADARGQTLKEVVTAPHQFEGYKSPGREIKKAMDNKQVRNRVREIIRQVDYGEREVAFPNADHFHTPKVNPAWAKDKTGKINKDGTLGGHIFYSTPQSTKVAQRRISEREELGLTPPESKRFPAPTPPERSPNVPDAPPTSFAADQPQQATSQSGDPIGDLITANSYAPEAQQPAAPAVEGINQAFGTSRSPFTTAGRQALEESRSAELEYNMQGKRNLTVKQQLENNIIDAVTDVYGPGYKVSVISGRQQKGVSRGVVGSRRHNTAAADVYIYDSEGQRVTGNDLVPLAQYWLASEKGSIGFPAKPGQSMHMDLFGGKGEGAEKLRGSEGKLWYYGKPTPSQRKALSEGRDKKTMPKVLAKDAPTPPSRPTNAPTRATLTTSSNLNTPEESDVASYVVTGKPRDREELFKQGNKIVSRPIASQGNANVMAQFQTKSSQGDPDVMAQFKTEKPTPVKDRKYRGAKRGEIDDPAFAAIGTQRGAEAPAVAQVTDTVAQPAAPAAPETPEAYAESTQVAPVNKKSSPNLLQQATDHLGNRFNEIGQNFQNRIESVQGFINDPVGTFRQRGQEMGERVRERLQPLAQRFEGPDYSAADQEVRSGHQYDGYGSNLTAVGPQGTKRVNVSRSDTDYERDAEMHPGQNMEAYRANKAVFQKYGLPMTSSNSKKLLEMGETLYVPSSSESKYSGSSRSGGSSSTRRSSQRQGSSGGSSSSSMDDARARERERRREQRRSEREQGINSGI